MHEIILTKNDKILLFRLLLLVYTRFTEIYELRASNTNVEVTKTVTFDNYNNVVYVLEKLVKIVLPRWRLQTYSQASNMCTVKFIRAAQLSADDYDKDDYYIIQAIDRLVQHSEYAIILPGIKDQELAMRKIESLMYFIQQPYNVIINFQDCT